MEVASCVPSLATLPTPLPELPRLPLGFTAFAGAQIESEAWAFP